MDVQHESDQKRSDEKLLPESDPTSEFDGISLGLYLRYSDAGIEQRFTSYYVSYFYRFAQASLVIGLVLILGDFLVDHLAFPNARSNMLRMSVAAPILCAAIAYSFYRRTHSNWQPVMGGVLITLSLALFWTLTNIDHEGGMGLKSWVGVLNFTFVEFYVFVILGVQFRFALPCGLVVLAAFLVLVQREVSTSAGEFAYWTYHVVTVFILAAGVGWWRELLIRKDYLVRMHLDEARRAAERDANIKSEFLANMSHEIRTPLNGVLGLAQIGHRESVGRERTRQMFSRILESGRLLLAIVNDVLDFSKIEAGKLAIESMPIDPRLILDEAVAALELPAREKGLALNVEKATNLPAAFLGDPLRISQVLLNLLSNAVKFTERGEVRLSASLEANHLVFRVTDTGIGISAQNLEKLFLPFEQGDSSTTRKFGGTGLGLAISRQLASLMGGELRVQSTAGAGSEFQLRLPCVAMDEPDKAPPVAWVPDATSRRLAGTRILVAEDNALNQVVIEEMLSREGAQVTLVGNGRLALDAIGSDVGCFDLVLMDVQMPEMDGLEAARRIREIAPDIPIVGQTAHAFGEDRDNCRAAGMAFTISKPIDLETLISVVRHHALPGSGEAPLPVPPASIGASEPEITPGQTGLNLPQLELAHAGRPDFLLKVLGIAITSQTASLNDLRECRATGDRARLAFVAHTIKGAATTLFADDMYALAVRTEAAARTATAEADDLAQELENMVAGLIHGIEAYLAANAESSG